MGEDATLGDFADGSSESGQDGAATDPIRTEAPSHSSGAVEPATTTYRFDPDGGTCTACGADVERRWGDDEGLVCADCKEW